MTAPLDHHLGVDLGGLFYDQTTFRLHFILNIKQLCFNNLTIGKSTSLLDHCCSIVCQLLNYKL